MTNFAYTLADNGVTASKLGLTVQTYTSTGDGGGTGYYINLGGIKMCWGRTGSFSVTGAQTKNITMPSSFFTNVRSGSMSVNGSAVFNTQLASSPTTSTFSVYFGSGTGSAQISWFVIGD